MKTEALKLADELDALHQYVPSEAPALIRRLVEELDCAESYIKQYQLEKQSEPYVWHMKSNDPDSVKDYWYFIDKPSRESKISHQAIPLYTTPQTKPFTNEEIAEIYKDFTMFNTPYWFARAIEERHGIK